MKDITLEEMKSIKKKLSIYIIGLEESVNALKLL